AFALGTVEAPVSRGQQLAADLLVQLLVGLLPAGKTDRYGDWDTQPGTAAQSKLIYADPNTLCHLSGQRRSAGRQNESKLLAAVTRNVVGLTQQGLNLCRHLLQYHVARLVTVLVIDLLEVIDIGQHQCQG